MNNSYDVLRRHGFFLLQITEKEPIESYLTVLHDIDVFIY